MQFVDDLEIEFLEPVLLHYGHCTVLLSMKWMEEEAEFAILECERNEHRICSGMIAKWMGLSDGNTVNREFQVFRKCPHDAME